MKNMFQCQAGCTNVCQEIKYNLISQAKMVFVGLMICLCMLIGVFGQINPPIPVNDRMPGSVLGNGADNAQV